MKNFAIVGAFYQTSSDPIPHSGICGALYAPSASKETPVPFYGAISCDDNSSLIVGETYDCYGRAVIMGSLKDDILSFQKEYGGHPDKIKYRFTKEADTYIGTFQAENAGQKSVGRAKCCLIPLKEDFFKL